MFLHLTVNEAKIAVNAANIKEMMPQEKGTLVLFQNGSSVLVTEEKTMIEKQLSLVQLQSCQLN